VLALCRQAHGASTGRAALRDRRGNGVHAVDADGGRAAGDIERLAEK